MNGEIMSKKTKNKMRKAADGVRKIIDELSKQMHSILGKYLPW